MSLSLDSMAFWDKSEWCFGYERFLGYGGGVSHTFSGIFIVIRKGEFCNKIITLF